MTNRYFLGANSAQGFHSLYGGFGEDLFLHVIKGGPGTGKSTLMRRLGAEAEQRGLDVEYLLCSGDPDSLDGLCIPALRQAWIDGTAPHVREPSVFGADGDYVNLSRFCRLPLPACDRAAIAHLHRAYRDTYRRAYACLAAAGRLRRAAVPAFPDCGAAEKAERRVLGILRRHTRARTGRGQLQKRFLSALSCRGKLRLSDEVEKLCKLFYSLDDALLLAGPTLLRAAGEAVGRGLDVILCPSPLEPDVPEAVLLPQDGLALLSGGGWELPGQRHVRLDALVPAALLQEHRASIRGCRRLAQGALDAGLDALARAKEQHDELELLVRPHMDFAALGSFTERLVRDAFS